MPAQAGASVPLASLRRRPWHFGSAKWYRRVAWGLYAHHCPIGGDVDDSARMAVCYEPSISERKGPKAPRVPATFPYPVHEHTGPYAFPLSVSILLRRTALFILIPLRRSLGRTKHPAVWLVLRQLLVILPVVAIAGAAGQSVLAVQVLVISILIRVPYQTFRYRLWTLAYHQRSCPTPLEYRPYRLPDVTCALAAMVEVIPVHLIGISLWLLVSPSPEATVGFIAATVGGSLAMFIVSMSMTPVLAHWYYNNRPDIRHVLAVVSSLTLAFGTLLYAPTSILNIPAWLETALQYVPLMAIVFLPLRVGVAEIDMTAIAISAALTVVISAALWLIGRNGRRDLAAWEPDYDDEDDDEL